MRAIREQICDGLGDPGIELNRNCNATQAPLTSADAGRGKVRGICTGGKSTTRKSCTRVLNLGLSQT
jgi:hypothetical protein